MVEVSTLIGTWELTSVVSGRTITRTLKIKEDMTGTYTSVAGNEADIADLSIVGDQVAFKVTLWSLDIRNRRKVTYTIEFKGRLDGLTLKLKRKFIRSDRSMQARLCFISNSHS